MDPAGKSKRGPPAFYKAPAPKTNNYHFNDKDRDSQVIRNKFQPPPSPPTPQVTEGSRAEKAGIKLGDSIVKINNMDTSKMTLNEAHKNIEKAGNNIRLSVKNFEDEDDKSAKPKEEHEISFGGNKSEESPRDNRVSQSERKVWHPVVWQETPSPVPVESSPTESYGQDAPHKRIIRNIRRLLISTEDQPEERQKHIEHMLLALPTASKATF